MKIVAIIPARMGSSRFPGKPLAPILGKSMIEHIYRRVSLCEQLHATVIATCDEEIRQAAENFGAPVVMTSSAHERASDRVAEAAQKLEADLIVMVLSISRTSRDICRQNFARFSVSNTRSSARVTIAGNAPRRFLSRSSFCRRRRAYCRRPRISSIRTTRTPSRVAR